VEIDDTKHRQSAEIYSLTDTRIERIFANFTPEQWLKIAVINSLVPAEYIADALLNHKKTVDEMFYNLATWLFPDTEDSAH
jgi:hypothetical protein